MNRAEAKTILLLYRSRADAADPQMAEALALVSQDAELARWFEDYCATQNALREKFHEIPVPAGLKEQILSERKIMAERAGRKKMTLAAATAVLAVVAVAAILFQLHRLAGSRDFNTFANYQGRMMYMATGGYSMDFPTNDLKAVQSYLARNQAPADYTLPAPLEKTATTGCAVQDWMGSKVSMICFNTGKSSRSGGDLWLFIVDRASVKGTPAVASPQFTRIDRLVTATWAQGDKLYVLGTEGDEATLRKYL